MESSPSFSEIINRWPSLADFATDLGVPFNTAKNWRARESVPARYWADLLRHAERRGLPVSSELLTHAASRRAS